MSDTALNARAEAAGLLPEWQDITGATRTVPPDTLRAALDALGDIAAGETVSFVTTDCGRPTTLPVSGLAALTLENGESRDLLIEDGIAPPIAEPGYHRIDIAGRVIDIAVAPPKAIDVAHLVGQSGAWGAAAQIYSLRGSRAAPFGDFRALAEFAGAIAGRGADALAISPVHALFTAEPERFSPYSPSSRDWLNPLFAAPEDGPEPAGGALIDWPDAAKTRLAFLRAEFDAFAGDADCETFIANGGGSLHGHALFEALHHHLHDQGVRGGWPEWPAVYHDPAGAEVAAFAARHEAAIRFHLYLQWRADRDLAAARPKEMRIGLIADLAVGLDPGGSHAWSRRDELLRGLTLGAPPDAFNADGQGWAIPWPRSGRATWPARARRLAPPRLRAVPAHAAHGAPPCRRRARRSCARARATVGDTRRRASDRWRLSTPTDRRSAPPVRARIA